MSRTDKLIARVWTVLDRYGLLVAVATVIAGFGWLATAGGR